VVRPWYITQAQGPAGSTLAMSASDLASFGEIFLRGGLAENGERVLSEAAVDTMTTPVVEVPSRSYTEHWCVGLEREHWNGTPVFGHAGGNMSGTSYLKIFPALDGVLALTCNTPAAFGAFSERIFGDLASAVFGVRREKLTAPDSPPAIDNADRYVGTYTMLGATYEVMRDGDGLRMKITTQIATGDSDSVEYPLVPLRDDTFLPVSEDGPTETSSLFGDVGFFGDDGSGRATNLVAPVFAARRVQ
jgi:CubicO group peptidase (beta-lactamase class C family)